MHVFSSLMSTQQLYFKVNYHSGRVVGRYKVTYTSKCPFQETSSPRILILFSDKWDLGFSGWKFETWISKSLILDPQEIYMLATWQASQSLEPLQPCTFHLLPLDVIGMHLPYSTHKHISKWKLLNLLP